VSTPPCPIPYLACILIPLRPVVGGLVAGQQVDSRLTASQQTTIRVARLQKVSLQKDYLSTIPLLKPANNLLPTPHVTVKKLTGSIYLRQEEKKSSSCLGVGIFWCVPAEFCWCRSFAGASQN
jgi:hypothetical protein